MKRRFAASLLLSFLLVIAFGQGRVNPNNHYVKGHYRNGTWVEGHHRTNPNGTNRDNYSTRGNTNPWTMQPGWIPPDNNPLPSYSESSRLTNTARSYSPILNINTVPASRSNSSNSSNANSYTPNTWSSGYYDLSAGDRTINYTNGREEFKVAAPMKIVYHRDRTYFSFDVYKKEVEETEGGAEGQLLLNGPYRFYDQSGALRLTENYKHGLKHGSALRYDESGSLLEKMEYFEGLLTYFKFTDEEGTTFEMFGVMEQPKSRLLISNQTGLFKKVEFLGNSRTKHTEYDPATKITIQEYDEIDGQRNGNSRRYFPNGQLKEKGIYQDGIPNGPFELYHENGQLSMKGTTSKGVLNGEIQYYNEQGKLESKFNYSNGLLNGTFVSYYQNKPATSGTYLEGNKHGRWNYYWVDSTTYYLAGWQSFANGILNGPFREIHGDSILTGTYKNGLVDGDFRVYRPILFWLLGQPPKDLTEQDLICSGKYSIGQKTGHWKCFSISKTLIEEGDYWLDKKHGEWRYYFDTYAEAESGQTAPYSGQLFLVENYQNGEKYGRSERLAYLNEIIVPCDTSIGTVNPLDTCYQLSLTKVREITYYKNGVLHGPFEWHDDKNQLARKGEFRMGQKFGLWIQTYVDPLDTAKTLRYEAHYSQDQLNGVFQKFDANTGIILEEGNYIEGQKFGTWREYFPDSKKRIVWLTEYVKDKRISAKNFDYEGRLVLSAQYREGNLYILERMDPAKNRVEERFEKIQFNAGVYHFDHTIFGDSILQLHRIFEAGSLAQEQDPLFFTSSIDLIGQINPERIYLDGPFTLKNKTGITLREGQFQKGHKTGVWKDFFYDQKVMRSIQYETDKKVSEQYYQLGSTQPFTGKFLTVIPNEGTQLIIKIKKGLRNGYTFKYDRQGKLIKKTKYKAGLKVDSNGE